MTKLEAIRQRAYGQASWTREEDAEWAAQANEDRIYLCKLVDDLAAALQKYGKHQHEDCEHGWCFYGLRDVPSEGTHCSSEGESWNG